MENKKSILTGSVIASAILGLSNISANASTLTNYSALGSGSEVRAELLGKASALKTIELTCSDSKTKDAKCSKEGKAKDAKCSKDAKAKAKDGKCGEGKCGDSKKATK